MTQGHPLPVGSLVQVFGPTTRAAGARPAAVIGRRRVHEQLGYSPKYLQSSTQELAGDGRKLRHTYPRDEAGSRGRDASRATESSRNPRRTRPFQLQGLKVGSREDVTLTFSFN